MRLRKAVLERIESRVDASFALEKAGVQEKKNRQKNARMRVPLSSWSAELSVYGHICFQAKIKSSWKSKVSNF